MKVITVANHKGGVGKTALAAHLAWHYAEEGANVIAVDLDAQANFTGTFTSRDQVVRPGGSDALFVEDVELPQVLQISDRLGLVRASIELDQIDARSEVESIYAFRDRLRTLAAQADVVVIDTPPSLKARTTAALASSQAVFTPFMPEVFSITGLEDLLRHIARVRRNINHGLAAVYGVVNLVNPQAAFHAHMIDSVSTRLTVLRPLLHRRIAVAEALAHQQPVWSLKSAKAAGDEWKALCAAIVGAVR